VLQVRTNCDCQKAYFLFRSSGFSSLLISFSAYGNDEFVISPDERPVQYEEPQAGTALIETTSFIHAAVARNRFNVSGDGLTVAILDTGLRRTHSDFLNRISTVQNFTTDDSGDKTTVTDLFGHGTHVAGIIAANGYHTGIAPRASLIPLKVLRNDGGGSYTALLDALNWVIDNHSKFGITVVNLSLGDQKNLVSDESFSNNDVRLKIAHLRAANVPVVVAAGNNYYNFKSQGMGFPAILRETVSVGAVYDSEFPHGIDHKNGAISYKAIADRLPHSPNVFMLR